MKIRINLIIQEWSARKVVSRNRCDLWCPKPLKNFDVLGEAAYSEKAWELTDPQYEWRNETPNVGFEEVQKPVGGCLNHECFSKIWHIYTFFFEIYYKTISYFLFNSL